MFRLVALLDGASADIVLDQAVKTGNMKAGTQALERLMCALMPGVVSIGQDSRPQGGVGWHVDAAVEQ